MDTIDEIIKNAQKEIQKIKIRSKGLDSLVNGGEQRMKIQKNSELEAEQAKQSLSKNSAALQKSIKGNFADKLTETFEKQKQTLENI
ncbi:MULTISPECIES: hypothetical protein [Lactococcus]|uniref:hypothetical protein n=1 Tax=Lactococcus TaxID=1357 RepID=UPI00203CBE6D|nr:MULTISPECIES: hypothetical protein [Lactococcus]